ncbi:hypothetical protein PanWU01x14_013480 [Parasponia andersonii]|uniref:Transmembrane protein n=1 Tax=Parasponia andersonii TaxID=3476 RepID=A0A2P5E134_PARAD|nr:hypothetical protein PanWU01x14_013480 [Parasponia andersonii]
MSAAFDGPVSSCLPCVRPISTPLASSSTSASSFVLCVVFGVFIFFVSF